MSRYFIAGALLIVLVAATTTAPVLAQRPTARVAAASGVPPTAGFTLPLQLTPTGQGPFSGILRITGFAADGTNLFATGLITGTMTSATGLSSIVKNVTIPVPFPVLGTTAPGIKTTGACDILNLALGPLDVNLLGIQVHLDQVVLDLGAAGDGLLGALICTITGLLGGAGTAADAATSLNQLVGTLGG